MKKLLLSLALVATMVGFNSCGGDEPYTPQITTETINATNLINTTITMASNSVNYIESANYTFNIEYRDMREATIKVRANGVKFDSHMPFAVSFEMEDIKTYTLNDYYVKFNASNVKFLKPGTDEENEKYKLTNVSGYIDKVNEVYSLAYTVNDTWRVVVCNSTIKSSVKDNIYDGTSELHYIYKIDINKMKAELFIYNVQFSVDGATSPVLKKISIPNIDVTATASGFDLTGNEIVPTYYTGSDLSQGTPYPALIVTNFNSKIEITSSTHYIQFNAHGGEHEMNNYLYLWSWTL